MIRYLFTAEAQLDFHLKRFNEVSVSMASNPENHVDLVSSSTTKAVIRTTSTTVATTVFHKKSMDNRVKVREIEEISYSICLLPFFFFCITNSF